MAFSADPVMRWLYPEAHAYIEHLSSFIEAFAGRAFEHATAWVAGDFGGAAMWLPHEIHVDDDAVGSVVLTTIEESRQGDTIAVLEEMDRYHIDEPHWYLPMIGVDPSHQGQGLGAALLQHALSKCDEASLPAYLESSNEANLSLYKRHGFEVITTIQSGSSPEIYPMLRNVR